MFHLVLGISFLLASVPVEMHNKALRWRSSKRRADRRTLASHRCLEISASSRNGLPRSKMRTLPIYSFISHHTVLTFIHSSSTTKRHHYRDWGLFVLSLSSMLPKPLHVSFILSVVLPPRRLFVFSFHHHPTAGLIEKNSSSNNSCWSHTPGSNNKITNPVLII